MWTKLTRRDYMGSSLGLLAVYTSPSKPRNQREHWILKSSTRTYWEVEDPVTWAMSNVRHPILERAKDGLLSMSPEEGDRVRRLITRRCGLNLIGVHSPRVEVQYWGRMGLADLRPFFKRLDLGRLDVEVVLRDRKHEQAITQRGSDFLYGDPLRDGDSYDSYWKKWYARQLVELDDWTAAPLSGTGYSWRRVEPCFIPWAALKAIWRLSLPVVCLNCDRPTILTKFDSQSIGMFNQHRNLVQVCSSCRKSFQTTVDQTWIAEHLDRSMWPDFETRWGRSTRFMS